MSFSIQWLPNRGVTAPQGFRAAGARAAIKTEGDDIALLLAPPGSSAAAVFTTNQVKAAPVLISAQNLAKNRARAIIVNAGNANCCTGARGLENAQKMAALAAQKLGIKPEEVLVCSTGIIGHQLPMEKIETALQTLPFTKNEESVDKEIIVDEETAEEISADEGIAEETVVEPIAVAEISEEESAIEETTIFEESGAAVDERVARAFMTTDTVPKFCAAQMEIGGKVVTVGGQAKGVGMIGPNMAPLTLHATLLAFLTTDAQIERELLQKLLERAVARSFNSVTVDGDMSTNDTAILLASGESGAAITAQNAPLFSGLLDAVCIELGKKIARDGEGATKLIEIQVKGARREEDAKKIALTIANSPLVKTAIFGKDPNWGRIAMAAGRAGVSFDAQNLSFSLGNVEMFRSGEPVDFDLKSAEQVLESEDVQIALDLGEGSASWTAWTCDFSYDYVKINAEYHT
ncbi:bifunctional ornithine acetyltransferase/N-acetylglutamate synthase [Abditibacterium utsteinense]|uniref:bifunctional ornithine acetyltransferase/N-acetylglutamate synthase n=1 Tax=Abditibacterium utsteinense TaxID=1960156 RepID=UPI001300753B|nr:bifunctional ornithine acetyltransferase/N-acetylglutamate synthase [Abditibacterium utsteinense]